MIEPQELQLLIIQIVEGGLVIVEEIISHRGGNENNKRSFQVTHLSRQQDEARGKTSWQVVARQEEARPGGREGGRRGRVRQVGGWG